MFSMLTLVLFFKRDLLVLYFITCRDFLKMFGNLICCQKEKKKLVHVNNWTGAKN